MSGYDPAAHQRYLEAPYVDHDKRMAEFERWCEANPSYDPESEEAWDAFEEWEDEMTQEIEGPDPDDERELAWEREMDKDYIDYGD